MNLYIFPEAASSTNGYGIGVATAYLRLDIKPEDMVVWMTTTPKEKMMFLRDQDIIIQRPKMLSLKSVVNTIKGTNRSELNASDLSFLKGKCFDNIYCDEVIFFRALRKIYPDQLITVRLHNCFARIYDRLRLLRRNVDLKFKITLRNMYKLERDVFNDNNSFKIFISNEDRDYYTSHYGKTSDSSVFDYSVNRQQAKANRLPLSLDNRLIWYGGVESHKQASVEWFIADVFPRIKSAMPDIEFHLWGNNTAQFDNPSGKIFGHGFFEGDGMPSQTSLYVNPDIIGGGIKLKLMYLIESGLPVISTPFGFEGYSHDIIDNEYCIVQNDDKWVEYIIDYLKAHRSSLVDSSDNI